MCIFSVCVDALRVHAEGAYVLFTPHVLFTPLEEHLIRQRFDVLVSVVQMPLDEARELFVALLARIDGQLKANLQHGLPTVAISNSDANQFSKIPKSPHSMAFLE